MPGIRCRVDSCRNSVKGTKHTDISFHKFPKNPHLRKVWIKFTRKPGSWNPDNSYICSDHFSPDEFIRNLQAELLQLPARRRVLKKTAVPSVYNAHKKPSEAKQKRIKRYEERERKRIVEELLAESERQERLTKSLADVGLEIPPKPTSLSVTGPSVRQPTPKAPSSDQPAYGLYLLGGPPYSVIAQPIIGGSAQLPSLLPKPNRNCGAHGSPPDKSSSSDIIVKKVIVGSNEKPKTVVLNKPIFVNDQSPPKPLAPSRNSPPAESFKSPEGLSPIKDLPHPNPQPVVLLSGIPPPNLPQDVSRLGDSNAGGLSQQVNSTLGTNGGGSPIYVSKLRNQLVTALNPEDGSIPSCGNIKGSKKDPFIFQLKMKVAELTSELKNKNRIIREQRAKIKKLATELVKFKKDKVPTSYVIESLTDDDPPIICFDHNYAVNGQKGKGAKGQKSTDAPPAIDAQPPSPIVTLGCPLPDVEVLGVDGKLGEEEGIPHEEVSMMYVLPCDPGIEPFDTHFLLETDNVIVERMEYT